MNNVGVILSLIFVLISGCAVSTSGNPFDIAQVEHLSPGNSTIQEAISLLGSPYQVVSMENDNKLYIWQHVQAKANAMASSAKVFTQQAAIIFDSKGVMVRVQQIIDSTPPT